MNIQQYLESVKKRYKAGISSEHTYRGDLEALVRELVPGVEITNEPKDVTDCGNPDYVITKGKIPVGYIEAKDLGKDLNGKQYKEQFSRYKKALDNLIITDYLWFQFFKEGELVAKIRIGELEENKINPLPENFEEFSNRITNFCTYIGQTIKSSKKLAEMMAAKARLLQNIIENALNSDEKSAENSSLMGQFETFKSVLIHDLDTRSFADIYAQTLAYGMFAARYHDLTPNDFSRYEAAELIPKTNPFLKKLFTYIAGPDIDERIKRTVDNLAEVFRAVDLDGLLHNFGKSTQTHDPIIHFYETFLAEYDPKLRKSRGVWYTPEPVVNFIVRAVDDILKTEFNLPQGLADTSKTKIKLKTQTTDKRTTSGFKEVEQEVHKVQILDPATGTGTFLAEVVKFIYNKQFTTMQGAWSSYVDEHLIPRLNGFELLMASYAMAHLKLDMLLTETGYKATKAQRFNIYLTNSLEEHHPDTGTLFSNWLSTEANEANHIKRDTPVMVVMGNPPYSVSSTNKSEWIEHLMKDYKKNLNERNIQPLSDDYIKFIRYGQYYIEKNGEGILAYISNNSFIDGLIHRQMRKDLMRTFDKIYILDLHGNSKKKETTPDGGKDENVFDIMQGVSINIFVKSKKNKSDVFHFDVYGTRKLKYDFLRNNSIASLAWSKLNPTESEYFFVKQNLTVLSDYNEGIKVDILFNQGKSGVTTEHDNVNIAFSKGEKEELLYDFQTLDVEILKKKYDLKNTRDWTIKTAKDDLINNKILTDKINYRCFDARFINYTGTTKGIATYPRREIMQHLLKANYGLVTLRQSRNNLGNHFFVSDIIIGKDFISSLDRCTIFPLYLYPETSTQQTIEQSTKRAPNLNIKIVNEIAEKLGLAFVPEKEPEGKVCYVNNPEVRDDYKTNFAPIDILDYIYAVLHSPTYREKYKEFLKIDFPRVPYPKNAEIFWQLVGLGQQIRKIHLLEEGAIEQSKAALPNIADYPEAGTNTITTKIGKADWEITDDENQTGRIWINDSQYFGNIPQVAWEYYIGGYQPAQKWLKDRKGRTLTFEDILHYQKIIVALAETDRLMKEIDKLEIE